MRPIGIRLTMYSTSVGSSDWTQGVWMTAGATALTRMPVVAISLPELLAATNAISSAHGWTGGDRLDGGRQRSSGGGDR
jgi:hypothetical protein